MSKMREILDAAKGHIFEDESPAITKNATAPQPTAQPVASVISTIVVSSPTAAQFHQVNPEIKVQLDQAVAEANQLSYTEFLNYLEAMSLALASTDEATRYRAALAAAARKGFASQEIVRGIDTILQVLQNEERHFNEAASQRIAERVGAREAEVADIDRQIVGNNNKIAELQNQSSQLNARKRAASEEIRSEKQKVEDKKKDFSSTVSAEKSRYQDERSKVLTYSGKEA